MKLSINLNKIALLRNSRGNNNPSLIHYANECIALGVDGLTLHPRPDHRHATSEDVISISKLCKRNNIEFNLEGNPFSLPDGDFLGFYELCKISTPSQITLVPDSLDQVTSDHGWQKGYCDNELKDFVLNIKKLEYTPTMRISLFIDADISSVEYAAEVGADRIEIYTGPLAYEYENGNSEKCNTIEHNIHLCIEKAKELRLGVNAGHDLNLYNIPVLKNCGIINEVSIGHAIMVDALKFGFHDTIMKYIESVSKD